MGQAEVNFATYLFLFLFTDLFLLNDSVFFFTFNYIFLIFFLASIKSIFNGAQYFLSLFKWYSLNHIYHLILFR